MIVTKQLPREAHEALRILTQNTDRDDVRRFLLDATALTEPGDKANVDAVLQVSMTSNKELYEKLRKEEIGMCDAMRILFKDELEEREARGVVIGEARGETRGRISAFHEIGLSDEEISKRTGKPVDVVRSIIQSLSSQKPVKEML